MIRRYRLLLCIDAKLMRDDRNVVDGDGNYHGGVVASVEEEARLLLSNKLNLSSQ